MTSIKIGQLFTLAYTKPLSAGGAQQPGAQLTFYASGSGFATSQPVYADSALTTTLTQPIVADTSGRFVPVFMNPALQYASQLSSAAGTFQADPVNVQNTAIPMAEVVKASTTTRASTTTLTVDPDLSFFLSLAGTYKVELDIQITAGASGTTPGFSYEISFSGTLNSAAGNTFAVAGLFDSVGVSNSQAAVALNSPVTGIALGPSGIQNIVRIAGTIQTTSAGTLSFLWAQNVSSSSQVSVVAGSDMTITRIA
jgi:hypothetical protein